LPLEVDEAVVGIVERARESMRWYIVWAAMLLSLGVLIFIVSSIIGIVSEPYMKVIVGAAATFVSSLSTFPVREIIDRRQQIGTLNQLRDEYRRPDGDREWVIATIKDRIKKDLGV